MGSVVLSIDAELAWGFHDLERPPTSRIESARPGWRRLLEWLDAYEVPATWAVVGHLMLDACDGDHADHPGAGDGWFARDPGGTAVERDRWFGPELVESVRNAAVPHEIGCHTFSHVPFDPTTTDREVAAAELEACVRIAREWGVSLDSFVFPRNVVGHRDLLAEYGFGCYRGVRPPRWYDGARLAPLGKFASFCAGRSAPPLVTPAVDEYGLVDLPSSLCLYSFEGLARSLVEPLVDDPVVRKARLGVDAAAEGDGICHLWLHPNDLTDRRTIRRLRRILEYVDEVRRATDLRVETMGDVASRVRTPSEPTPTAVREELSIGTESGPTTSTT